MVLVRIFDFTSVYASLQKQFTSIITVRFQVCRLTYVVSDSDADGHEDSDDGEQGQQSVERRVGTMTTVTSDVPSVDRNVS